MKQKTKENLLGVSVLILYFIIGFWLGYLIGSQDSIQRVEIITDGKLVPSMPPATELKAENCTATGFVPETPFNEDYYNCEVVE